MVYDLVFIKEENLSLHGVLTEVCTEAPIDQSYSNESHRSLPFLQEYRTYTKKNFSTKRENFSQISM